MELTNPLAPPSFLAHPFKFLVWLVVWPLSVAVTLTVPKVQRGGCLASWPCITIAFFMSVFWIGVFSYVMVLRSCLLLPFLLCVHLIMCECVSEPRPQQFLSSCGADLDGDDGGRARRHPRQHSCGHARLYARASPGRSICTMLTIRDGVREPVSTGVLVCS